MKRKIKIGNQIVIMAMTTVLCLSGCGVENPHQEDDYIIDEKIPGVEKAESETQESVEDTVETTVQKTQDYSQASATDASENVATQTDFDVEKALEEAKMEASALQKKLQEDPSLTQLDMNTLSYEIYQVWDSVLNDLWNNLKSTLDEATMDSLLKEQRAWITEKESEVKQAGEAAGGGSLAPLVANQRAAELTRTRVYELAVYLGFEE